MTGSPSRYSISIVIPAYNEEGNIEEVVRRSLDVLRSLALRHEVVVVNDASRDRTGEILDRLANENPGVVRVIHHEQNKGTNLSLVELHRSAQCDLVFFLPADKQILPESLRDYLSVLENEGIDIVMGWRRHRRDPFCRAFFNWVYRACLWLFLGVYYKDACASDLYKKSVLDELELESQGRLLQAEIAVKARALGYRVKEIEVEHYPRVAGKQTGINPKTIWFSCVDLFRVGIKIRRWRQSVLK